ncbi:unnamed protein product [Didymodactylos carnosus]|uniref:Uncharacterized protein n=1 Tax=Didymodactylos carnosus TaxID=1234261 RepID=A0A815K8K2_9BILA|nr:unnamed protein product [Didymodactylos carnosus]CAF1389543.1 unnamed protein product [Didymodactylos carnosus]CAF3512320.1 unnamed protein product [Didymodactylos carnosus]CAF4284286.1 unnamed protein product [Didymodactylos carnosus]
MATSTRIFLFGLGHAPSRSLIKGLARATNGRFVFIPPGTCVDVYVGEQLQKALQPCITNVRIKLNLDSTLINVVPTSSPPVFINDRLIVYGILNNNKMTSFDHEVNFELYSEQHRLCEAKVNRIPNVSSDGMIARLAAKALILELQHSKLSSSNKNELTEAQQTEASNEEIKMTKEQIKEKIIEISLKHNILSPYTAFVGVEKRVNASNANLVLREVPIDISADNQYLEYLTTTISQMRHKQSKMLHEQEMQSRMRDASLYDRYDIDQMYGAASYIRRWTASSGSARQHFDHICTNYHKARAKLAVTVKNYEEARQDCNLTCMDENEAQKRLDCIRNDYDKARKQLDQTRMEYNGARQHLDSVRMNYSELEHRFGRVIRDYNDHRHHFAHYNTYSNSAWQNFDSIREYCERVQENFDQILVNYDRAQAQYDNVIDSIDKSYQIQKESPITTSDDNSQRLSQSCMKALNSTEKRFQQARESLEQCGNKNERIVRHLEEACDHIQSEVKQAKRSAVELRHSERVSSAEMRYAEELLREEHEKKQSSKKSREITRKDNQGDLDIVRDIIAQQDFDGLWKVDEKFIEKLIGKSLLEFQQLTNTEVLISAIIVIVLETRFASLSSMWYGVVQKARKRLLDMLDKDSVKFNTLLEDIRKQL